MNSPVIIYFTRDQKQAQTLKECDRIVVDELLNVGDTVSDHVSQKIYTVVKRIYHTSNKVWNLTCLITD